MPLKEKITPTLVEQEHHRQYGQLREKYGDDSWSSLPLMERSRADRVVHAMYVLMYWDGRGSALRLLKGYNIPTDVCAEVIERFCDGDEEVTEAPKRKLKMADRYRVLDKWAFDHPLEQITPVEMGEISGLSYASIMKFVKTSPRFSKVKNGLYEANGDQKRVI